MPELIISKTNTKRKSKEKINWDKLPYQEMVEMVEKLAGPKPNLPKDLPVIDWSAQAMQVLKERYFLKDADGKPIENVSEMCWRVAWELARSEVKFGKSRQEVIAYARTYYELMMSREFLPNSPTLMNAGKGNGLQYSACYVIPVEDSLSGIFDGIKWQALVHQSGGGTGFSFSRLRPVGSRVKSTMGVASGPVSFMKVYNEATQQIKQGGMRRGANMGILRIDHPDVLEFIHSKDDNVSITNFNISVTATNKFFEALAEDSDYELVDPHSGEVTGKLKAKDVWDQIAAGAWKTGDPGMIFIDRINESPANPIRAKGWEVESTNPCGEQPLYPFDACNLGSIFLKYFIKEDENGKADVNWEKLKVVTHTAVRMLDSVIEMNPFPLPQIADTVHKIRRIGLGVGGFADLLVHLGIPYDSEEAVELAEKVMKFINVEGHKESQALAEERGAFPLVKESIYKDAPMRNSTVTTIAPTGTIGILANNYSGIEPMFAVAYQHIVKSENRTLNFIDPYFEEVAKKRGFYSDELMKKVVEHGSVRNIKEIPEDIRKIFGTAHEIHPDWHVKMQAAFQKYTDNAVSKTINLPHDATVDDIKKAYMLAWNTGCRGITVFRDGSKNEQVLNLGVKKDEAKKDEAAPTVTPEVATIKPRPIKVEGATYKIATPMGHAFITVNHDEAGNPFEVFVTVGKAGSEVAAMAEALGRMISTTIRYGNHVPAIERAKELVDQLRGIGGGSSVGFGPNKVRSLPDAIAKAISMHFGLLNSHVNLEVKENLTTNVSVAHEEKPTQLTINDEGTTSKKKFDLCPSCGNASLVYEEGCKKCHSCGYSEC